MEMTIDEAIEHCNEVAERNEKKASWFWAKEGNPNYEDCSECASEHRQLVKWLKELKSFKEKEEPRTVCYEGDGYADGEMVYDMAYCPCCNHYFEEDSENWGCEFCPNCGQRLRWKG